nr:hypothetical protein [Escherichia coli]
MRKRLPNRGVKIIEWKDITV